MTSEPRSLLSRHRLRSTEGRLRILKLLASSARPLSAAEVHAGLGAEGPDLATVYRTLDRFAELSLAIAVRFGDGTRRFEIARGDHHHHMVCRLCGSVADLASCKIEPLEDLAMQRHGFRVESHSLELYGTCRRCAQSLQ